MAYHISNSPVLRGLLAPLSDACSGSVSRYDCHRFGDLDFLEAGALRCIGDSPSGRGFLQAHADHGRAEVSADLFFKALKSRRRLANLQSVNARLAAPMRARCEDPYVVHPELAGFELIAGDGHFHAAACHDGRNAAGKKLPTGHLNLLDMRTHHLNQLTMARRSDGGRGNEHDMRALRRSETDALRQGAPAGRKVLIVWDRAGISFPFWHRCKSQAGIYFISREKENMALHVVGNNPVDRSDGRNGGVLSDELVGPGGSGGHLLRRVRYRTPEGEVYSYLTTEMKIPPGLIALLYKQRWDIEPEPKAEMDGLCESK